MKENRTDKSPSELGSLTRDISSLIRDHFELMKAELREDSETVLRESGIVLMCGAGIAIGYLMLNLAVVLFVGWLTNSFFMTLTSFVLALLNIGGAGYVLIDTVEDLQNLDFLSESKQQLERSQEWLRQTRADRQLESRQDNSEALDRANKSGPPSKRPEDE